MTQNFTYENLIALFSYPFKDPHWPRKLSIAWLAFTGCFILPFIPGIFLAGYNQRIMRRIISGDGQTALPEWEDGGDLFIQGLKLSLATWIYMLPSFVLSLAGSIILLLSGFYTTSLVMSQTELPDLDLISLAASPTSAILITSGMIISFITSLVLPAALGHMVAKDRFAAAFNIGEWWPIFTHNLGEYVLAVLILLGAAVVGSLAIQFLAYTILLCCLVPIFWGVLTAYIGFLSFALYGRVYRSSIAKMAAQPAAQAL